MFKKKKEAQEFPTISKHDNIDYGNSLKTFKNVTDTYTTTTSVSKVFTPKRLVIVAVAAAVGVGYYFYAKHKKSKLQSSDATSSAKDKGKVGRNPKKIKGFVVPLVIAVVVGVGGFVWWKTKRKKN